MAKRPHTSNHRVGGKIVKVPRRFDQAHLDAGYHDQEWGEHSTPGHKLHGIYDGFKVDHIEGDPVFGEREDGLDVLVSGSPTGGPEFRITWDDGSSVTVLCADVLREYLRSSASPKV